MSAEKAKVEEMKALGKSYSHSIKAFWSLVCLFLLTLYFLSPKDGERYQKAQGNCKFLDAIEELWDRSRSSDLKIPEPELFVRNPKYEILDFAAFGTKQVEPWCNVYESGFVNFGQPTLGNKLDRAKILATESEFWSSNRRFFEGEGVDVDSLLSQMRVLNSESASTSYLETIREWFVEDGDEDQLELLAELSSERARFQEQVDSFGSSIPKLKFEYLSIEVGPRDSGTLIGLFLLGCNLAGLRFALKMEDIRLSLIQDSFDVQQIPFPGLAKEKAGFRYRGLAHLCVVLLALAFLPSVKSMAFNAISVIGMFGIQVVVEKRG